MDLTQLSADEKLEKYLKFNSNQVQQNTAQEYINYTPLKSVGKQDIDTNIPQVKPLVMNKPARQSERDFILNDSTMGLVNAKVTYDKKGDATVKQVDMRQFDSVKPIIDKLPDLKKITGSQKQVLDSIDKTKYDTETKNYLKLLAYRESTYNPNITNKYGYTGLYQFGDEALDWVGIKKSDYKSDMNKQHEAAVKLRDLNLKGLEQYIGKTIGGIKMTKNNMAAASHLGGQGNLLKFIKSNGKDVFKDGKAGDKNRTPITAYLKHFLLT